MRKEGRIWSSARSWCGLQIYFTIVLNAFVSGHTWVELSFRLKVHRKFSSRFTIMSSVSTVVLSHSIRPATFA